MLDTMIEGSEIAENSQPLPAHKPVTARFERALDSRGRGVTSLYVRNGRYYAQIEIPGRGSRRVPLFDENKQPVRTLSGAIAARNILQAQKSQGVMPELRRAPFFPDWVDTYIAWLRTTKTKNPLTIDKEESSLKGWIKTIGQLRVNQITKAHINAHVLARKKDGLSNRSVNLDVIALGNCLRRAFEDADIQRDPPTKHWKALEHVAPKRQLVSAEDIEKLYNEALRLNPDGTLVYRNGELLVNYMKLLQFSGARRNAGLAITWDDVDFNSRKLTIRNCKYGKTVTVDFNEKLEAHLKEMHARRIPDCNYLFPSPLNPREPAKTLTNTFETVRAAAGLTFNYHSLRHYFISWAVMSGLDTLTVASWVGHSDGGVLIGKVYGHLNDEHKQKAAARLSFGVTGSPAAPVSGGLDLSKISAADLLAAVAKLQGSK